MRKFVQISDNKAHWIFEAESRPLYPDDVIILDITDNSEVKEGWIYDSETKIFSAPNIMAFEPIPTAEDIAEETLLETKYQTLLLEMMI